MLTWAPRAISAKCRHKPSQIQAAIVVASRTKRSIRRLVTCMASACQAAPRCRRSEADGQLRGWRSRPATRATHSASCLREISQVLAKTAAMVVPAEAATPAR